MPTVAVIATLDTKGREADFLAQRIRESGTDALIIDVGVNPPVACTPDVTNVDIAAAAGTDPQKLIDADDRGAAVTAMAAGLTVNLRQLVDQGKVNAVLGIGGSGGTSIVAAACRALPVGIGKLIVSTMASGQTRPYVGTKDIALMYSIADIEGLNAISIPILANAAAAAAGMANAAPPKLDTKPLIGISMFGVTTPCVKQAIEIFEAAGYDTVVFHATGTGGQAFESLIAEGFFKGILDVTTTEWCDELVGGILSAGPERLDAAAKSATPQVVCPGALDMVNFGPKEDVPEKFAGRNFYIHNPTVTLMRTTPEENQQLGKIIAQKLNAATGPTAFAFPRKGVSMIDAEGQPFDAPDARLALWNAVHDNLDTDKVELISSDAHINDPEFSKTIAEKLLSFLN